MTERCPVGSGFAGKACIESTCVVSSRCQRSLREAQAASNRSDAQPNDPALPETPQDRFSAARAGAHRAATIPSNSPEVTAAQVMLPALMLLAEGMVEFGRQAQRIADQLEYINGLADPVD